MADSDFAHIVGTGPRHVIALNGWLGHAQGWGPMAPSLDLAGVTYAFMEQRGCGRRQGSGGPCTFALGKIV